MLKRKSSNCGRQQGFSLMELLVAVGIIVVLGGIFAPKIATALQTNKVSQAYDDTLMTIRAARETAVSERRVYVVTFTSPNQVSVAPLNADTTASLNVTRTFPNDVKYQAITGIPSTATTTPDGFGLGPSTGAIDFDIGVSSTGTNTIYFWPDGSARDASDNINSGVLYIARTNDLMSSRAISVWGASGRIRGWRLVKNYSSGTTSWRQQ